MSKIQLENNLLSLCRSLKNHGETLSHVRAGQALFDYTFNSTLNRNLLEGSNIHDVTIYRDTNIDDAFYKMEFLKGEEPKSLIHKKVVIHEDKISIRKSLKKYVDKTGMCILHLKPQMQYIVEFSNNEVIAFNIENVKEYVNLECVSEKTVEGTVKGGGGVTVDTPSLGLNPTKEQIKQYLLANQHKIDSVVVQTRYFLAELD